MAERRVANARLSTSFGNMFGFLAILIAFGILMALIGGNWGDASLFGTLALILLVFASLLRWLGR